MDATTVARAVAEEPVTSYLVVLVSSLVVASLGRHAFRRRAPQWNDRQARLAVLVALLVASSSIALMTWSGSRPTFGRFDAAFASALDARPPVALSAFFARVTHLGDRTTLIALALVVAALLALLRHWLLTGGWLAACGGNALLNPSLKQLFARARPVHDAAYATVGEYGFPSGHTSGSVVVYGMLAYVAIRVCAPHRHRWIVLAAVATVATIATSRAFLRVHWVSDVIAGCATGSAWLVVCIVVVESLRRRLGHDRSSRGPL